LCSRQLKIATSFKMCLSKSIKNIFHRLLDTLNGTQVSQVAEIDIVEFLIMFAPGKLCPGTVNWDYELLPKHFQNLSVPFNKRNGYNHPHNLLHCLHVMPNSVRGRSLRRLLAYLYLQMTLGVADLDLPGFADMSDVERMMKREVGLWRALHPHHYAMRCTVGFLDAIFAGDASEIPHSSNNFEALRFVNSQLSEYGKRLPSMDPLNLDPVVVKEMTCELTNRWSLALQNSQGVFSLKERNTVYMAKGYENKG